MKKFIFVLALLLASPVMAAPMTSTQVSDAETAAKLIVHQVVQEPDGSYSLWTRSSVKWYGFTLYTCASIFANDLLAASVGQDKTTYDLANTVTPRGWKITWLKNPWGNLPPDTMPTWCLQ